jgi:hypothetical protein
LVTLRAEAMNGPSGAMKYLTKSPKNLALLRHKHPVRLYQ